MTEEDGNHSMTLEIREVFHSYLLKQFYYLLIWSESFERDLALQLLLAVGPLGTGGEECYGSAPVLSLHRA